MKSTIKIPNAIITGIETKGSVVFSIVALTESLIGSEISAA
jgi:hypothetical protein